MNQDTNREDRVLLPDVSELARKMFWHELRKKVKVCLSCGAVSDPHGNMPCPCGQPAPHP